MVGPSNISSALPPLYTCQICHKELSPGAHDVYQRVMGWSESKPGSINQTVTLAEQMYVYAHGVCVRLMKTGGQTKSQGSLF